MQETQEQPAELWQPCYQLFSWHCLPCRGRIAAAKSMAANGYGDVESGKQPLSHAPKTSIFSFWNAESAAAPSHPAAPDNPFLKDWRKAAQISAANEAKLR